MRASWFLASGVWLLAGSVIFLAKSVRQDASPDSSKSLRLSLFRLNEEIEGAYGACDCAATLLVTLTRGMLQEGRRVTLTHAQRFWFDFGTFDQLVTEIEPHHFELARDLIGLRYLIEFWLDHASQIDFHREWEGWGGYCLQSAQTLDDLCNRLDQMGSRIGGMLGAGTPGVCRANAHGAPLRRERVANLVRLVPA